MDIEGYCRWLSRRYFVSGADADDIFQEARLAAWLAPPGSEFLAALCQVKDLMKIGQRRRLYQLAQPEIPEGHDFFGAIEARERLGALLAAPVTANEWIALGRRIGGKPIGRNEPALDQAWYRLRTRATLAQC
jgi:hypothetical protein